MWWQQHVSEFVTFFLVMNPFSTLPVFLSLVATLEPAGQRKIAVYAVFVAFGVLVFFIFAGAFLLQKMSVPIRAFQIAGGILLFLVALDMIRGEIRVAAQGAEQSHLARAVYPLAIPKIAGPGAMLTAILLTDDDRFNPLGQLATVGVLAAVLLIQLIVLIAAIPISRLIGMAGASVIGRVMGMLLAALSVSMVLGAIGDWLNLPKL
ncbi:MAG: MarC family protein [Methylobacteriaceae bacterium]|nr:MarC family protein [Methylobacteriaceae bacterium]